MATNSKCDYSFKGVLFVSKYLVKKYGLGEAIRRSIEKERVKYINFKITLADPSVFKQEIEGYSK